MNIFIYDAFLDKYKKKVRIIEEKLNELKLQGKIIYLKDIKNLKDSINNEIQMGAKTIITVGNNETVNKVVNVLANISEETPIAIIPVGKNNSIAESLGILNEKDACCILSSRRIEKVKLAQASSTFFINNVRIKNKGTKIQVDNSYEISTQNSGECFIFNLPPQKQLFDHIKIDPQDEILNIYIESGSKNKTHFLSKNIEIKNEREKLILDDSTEISCPSQISVSDKSVNFIVGKDRKF